MMDRLNKVDKRVLVGAIITVAVLLSVGISIIIWFWNPWQQSTISLKQRGPYLTVEAKLEGSDGVFTLALDFKEDSIILIDSEGCDKAAWCKNHTTFTRGSWNSTKDRLTIGRLVFDKQVKVMKYDQLAARDAPWLKNDTGPVDGVIGIGPNSSFLRELLKEGLANTNESNGMHSVTLWVGKSEDSAIGKVGNDKCSAAWEYVDIPAGSTLWSVNLTNFPNKKNAIIDTQYAYIGLPDKPLSADDPENAFKGKCSEIRKNLDAHTFTIDTKNFTLKTEELMQDIDTEQGTCKALIRYSLDRASNMKDNWVLGRPFFRSFCVSFGYKKDDTMKLENPHLGLATNLS